MDAIRGVLIYNTVLSSEMAEGIKENGDGHDGFCLF